MSGSRKKFVEEALGKVGSRYLVCALVAKRANQYIKHSESQGIAWAVNQALRELVDGRIQPEVPELQRWLEQNSSWGSTRTGARSQGSAK